MPLFVIGAELGPRLLLIEPTGVLDDDRVLVAPLLVHNGEALAEIVHHLAALIDAPQLAARVGAALERLHLTREAVPHRGALARPVHEATVHEAPVLLGTVHPDVLHAQRAQLRAVRAAEHRQVTLPVVVAQRVARKQISGDVLLSRGSGLAALVPFVPSGGPR